MRAWATDDAKGGQAECLAPFVFSGFLLQAESSHTRIREPSLNNLGGAISELSAAACNHVQWAATSSACLSSMTGQA